jgi:hypothetical protein
MPGMVFAFQPSWLVEMGDDPEVPVLRTVADAGATVVVLERLSAMLEAAGLSDEVRSRDAQLGHIAYTHYGLRSNSEVMEVAASAVYRDGGLFGAACTRAVSQAFSIACNRIVGENSVPIGTAIRLMREAGHVDEDSAYDECGDSIYVAETGEGHGVMSVVTSHHRYRLEYDLDEDGIVGRLRLSIVDEPDGLDPMSAEHSFLGSYALSPDGHVTARPDDENGFHGGKVIRSLNDLTLSVSLAAEQIQQIGRPRLSR